MRLVPLFLVGITLLAQTGATDEVRTVDLATRLFQMQNDAKAVDILQDFLKTHPRSYRASLFLAFGLVREEKYAQSQRLLRSLIQREPSDYYAHHVMGLALVGLNQPRAAQTSFEKAIALRSNFAESYFQLGLLLAKSSDGLQRAYDTLLKALELGQEPASVQRQLGSVAIKLGRLDDAIVHLKSSDRATPDSPETWFLLADAYRKSGLATDAKSAVDRFASLNAAVRERKDRDTQAQALYQQGVQLLSSTTDLNGAYDKFRSAIEQAPALDPALYRMAQIEYLRGQLPAAARSIERAIELNPFEAEYHFVHARCLESSNTAGALDAARRAVELNGKVADFHNLLGNLLSKQGDHAAAVRSYQTAVSLEPASEAFKINLTTAQAKARGR